MKRDLAIKEMKKIITALEKIKDVWKCSEHLYKIEGRKLGSGAFSSCFIFPKISKTLVLKVTNRNPGYEWYVKFSKKTKSIHAPKIYYSQFKNGRGYYIMEKLTREHFKSRERRTITALVNNADNKGFNISTFKANSSLHKYMRNLISDHKKSKDKGWWDIHRGNFMIRSVRGKKVVVVTDPLAN